MEAEVLLKAVEGLGAIGLVAVAVAFMLLRRRDRNGNGVDHSAYVTNDKFDDSTRAGRKLAEERQTVILTKLDDMTKAADQDRIDAREDRRNLHRHIADHPGPRQ